MDVHDLAPGDLARERDPMARAFAPAAVRAWRAAGAVALVGVDAELRVPILLGLGAPGPAAELVAHAAGDLVREGRAVPQLVVARAAMGRVPAWLRPAASDAWEWRSLAAPPPVVPGEEHTAWLGTAAYDAVAAVLTAANPGSSVWPGDHAARRWAGVRVGGRLVACLADTSAVPGVGHVSGIATAVGARGRGYGAAVTAWAARRLLAEGASQVTLGVYAGNEPARRTYDRLGFSADHPMASGDPPG